MGTSVLTVISIPAPTSVIPDERIRIPAIVLRIIAPVILCERIKIAFSFFSRTSMREKGTGKKRGLESVWGRRNRGTEERLEFCS